MDDLYVCFSALNRGSDFLTPALQKYFKTIVVNSDSELRAFSKSHHLFCLVTATRLHNMEGLQPIRKLHAATSRLPTVLYGQVGSEELVFQLTKAGVNYFIPRATWTSYSLLYIT